MMVSGLDHLLGRVERSDLVQSGWDASPDVVEGQSRQYHSRDVLKTLIWAHFGPLGASVGL